MESDAAITMRAKFSRSWAYWLEETYKKLTASKTSTKP